MSTTTAEIATARSQVRSLSSVIQDSLLMGDAMYGQYAHMDVAKQVQERKKELEQKKASIDDELREKDAIIQRANRDFTDVRQQLPEKLPEKRIRFIEDYTTMFVMLSYAFMIVSGMIFYIVLSENKQRAFFMSLGGSLLLTFFAWILWFYLA